MVDVYWAAMSRDISSVRFHEPVKALSLFPHKEDLLFRCPAFKDYYNNLYALKFPLDYQMEITQDGNLVCGNYDADFNYRLWECRNATTRLYSFRPFMIFVAEQPLEIEITSAHTVEDQFNNNTYMVPGRYDIGKWFRTIECAFYAKSGVTHLDIKDGNPYLFLRFLTKEKVRLKQFHCTDDIYTIKAHFDEARMKSLKVGRPLKVFYDMLARSRYKAHFLKLVKQNLL